VLSSGPVLDIEAALGQTPPPYLLAGATTQAIRTPARPADASDAAQPAAAARPGTLEEIERKHVLDVLASTGGVIEGPKGAAQILAMHPSTLRSRMKRLGISATPTRAAET
jgi:transcriptional regulator with GAF, ATPase, and Fis domain